MNNKLTRVLLICVAPLGLLAAAAQAAQLTVWHAYRGGEKTAFEKVVKLYESKQAAKGVTVNTLAIPYDAYADKISAAVPRGKIGRAHV
jgi:arabinogalactan oligomer/maltooligosaccharide transport system substrate-binding protein